MTTVAGLNAANRLRSVASPIIPVRFYTFQVVIAGFLPSTVGKAASQGISQPNSMIFNADSGGSSNLHPAWTKLFRRKGTQNQKFLGDHNSP